MPGPARRKAQRYGCPGACRHQRPGRCPRQCSRRVLSRRPCWKGGTGLAGNSRGNPVMSHGQQAGQAPDQANEGGQAGARGAGDKSLERHVQRTVGHATSHPAPPGTKPGRPRRSASPEPAKPYSQARQWHGARSSSPRSGTPWATPGSPGRQGACHRVDRSEPSPPRRFRGRATPGRARR